MWIARTRGARFRLVLGTTTGSTDGISFGRGRIEPLSGSHPAALLVELAHTLGAAHAPRPPSTRHAAGFDFKVIGSRQSRTHDGSYLTSPPGDWTSYKLFFANDTGEVFLDVNARAKIAELSPKDPEYGDVVVAQLAPAL